MAKKKVVNPPNVITSKSMENPNAALSLEERFAQLEAQFKQATQESAAKDAVIAAQDVKLAAANAQGANALSVVTHEGKCYQALAAKFSLDNKVITHTDLKENAELVKRVVEEFPDLLQLIPDAKAAE
jgi:hypothetical protein